MELELLSNVPVSTPKSTPILLIHGAWHGAWCWENFLPYFAERGYAAYALSLRGHGNSEGRARLRWHSLDDYVDDVEWAVKQLPAKPVIVGHSMGGLVTQKYLEKHELPGAVLLATVPTHGIGLFALRLIARHPWLFLKVYLRLDMHIIVSKPSLVAEAFFSANTPAEIVNSCYTRLIGESFRFVLDSTFANLPNPKMVKSPVLVLAAKGDAVFSVAEEQKTALAYGTQAEIFEMAHDMMLEPGWEKVAARIAEWVDSRSG